MIKVLVIEPSGRLATFQYAHNLANALADEGHEVALATGTDFETRHYERQYLALEVFDRFLPRPARLWRFARFLRRFRPDIVHIQGHSHPTSYLLIRWLTLLLVDTRVVYTAQDVVPKFRKPHHMSSLRVLYRVVDHIFVNAEQNKRILREMFPAVQPEKISVVPLADLTHFVRVENPQPPAFMPAGCKTVLFFGNIERRKGLLVLLRAFRQVLETVPDARLLAAGKPFDDVGIYRAEIRRLGLDDSVTLKAEYVELEDIPGMFTHAQMLVLPYLEGWNSGVIATAVAYRLPVICSDIGGFDEAVTDGVTGLLVPPGDEKALATAIIGLLSDRRAIQTLRDGLETEARLQSWPSIARRVLGIYGSLTGQGHDAKPG